MKKTIIDNFSQILLIVFSVVLGLYLSERIEDYKNEKEAEQLMSKIKSELNENKKLLDAWAPYHVEIVNSLDSIINNKEFVSKFISNKKNLYQVFTRGTIMSETPKNDAWDIAKSHPLIVNIDYDELLALSRVYKQQEYTFEPIPSLVNLLISPDFNKKEYAQSNLQLFKEQLSDIADRETQLINYYNEANRLLKFQSN